MERAHLLVAMAMVLVVGITSLPPEEEMEATVESPATALFVLGDSSVNCGDNNLFFPLFPQNFSSTLCTPSHPRLLPDLIAEKMGLPPIPPFYGVNGTAEALTKGVNFGSTPAHVISGSHDGSFLFQSLSQQVRQAFETLQLLQLELGLTTARQVASSAVFLLSFGRDDYADLLHRDSAALVPVYGRRGFARILASQMIQAVQDLYDADVRRIAVIGVGPLGCSPRVVWEGAHQGSDDWRCVDEVNDLISGYNELLSNGLRDLSSSLPDAAIIFCHVYRGTMEIISNPHLYGMENVREACCGAGRYGGMIGCLAREMACEEPERHVWWDLYCTSEAVNRLIADWAWAGGDGPRICDPFGFQQLDRRTL